MPHPQRLAPPHVACCPLSLVVRVFSLQAGTSCARSRASGQTIGSVAALHLVCCILFILKRLTSWLSFPFTSLYLINNHGPGLRVSLSHCR